MTLPLRSVGTYARPGFPAPPSTSPVPLLARNTAHSVPDAPVSMMAAPPLVRVTADHLALIRALLAAGQTTRAMELLDPVWHAGSAEEQCWYLRLWLLTAEGRVLEALELSRVGVRELPGSVALAYLHAALEQAAGTPQAGLEAAARARHLAPDRPLPPELSAQLPQAVTATEEWDDSALGEPSGRPGGMGSAVVPPQPNPLLAAELGTALLYPLGSSRPRHAGAGFRISREAPLPALRPEYRRFSLLAAGTVVTALWAIHDPIPAFLALAAMVILTIRLAPR